MRLNIVAIASLLVACSALPAQRSGIIALEPQTNKVQERATATELLASLEASLDATIDASLGAITNLTLDLASLGAITNLTSDLASLGAITNLTSDLSTILGAITNLTSDLTSVAQTLDAAVGTLLSSEDVEPILEGLKNIYTIIVEVNKAISNSPPSSNSPRSNSPPSDYQPSASLDFPPFDSPPSDSLPSDSQLSASPPSASPDSPPSGGFSNGKPQCDLCPALEGLINETENLLEALIEKSGLLQSITLSPVTAVLSPLEQAFDELLSSISTIVAGCANIENDIENDITTLDSDFERAICAFTPMGTLPVVSDLVCTEGTQNGSGVLGLAGVGGSVSGLVGSVTSTVGSL